MGDGGARARVYGLLKGEKVRCKAEVELVWVKYEEEFRTKTCMDKMCMEALQQIRSSSSKTELPKE